MERTDRLNSLLKEVISKVIREDIHHQNISEMITITHVEITKDLHQAKVFVSCFGTAEQKQKALASLQQAASRIGQIASKKVVMRYFPHLTFFLDEGLDQEIRIQEILHAIDKERESRPDLHDPDLNDQK
jgi:ribosome-binding factor A